MWIEHLLRCCNPFHPRSNISDNRLDVHVTFVTKSMLMTFPMLHQNLFKHSQMNVYIYIIYICCLYCYMWNLELIKSLCYQIAPYDQLETMERLIDVPQPTIAKVWDIIDFDPYKLRYMCSWNEHQPEETWTWCCKKYCNTFLFPYSLAI